MPGEITLQYQYLPLPQFAPEATWAAQSAECAADQGKFWHYHDQLFSVATSRGRGGLEQGALIDYAAALGMDREQFSGCIAASTHATTVADSQSEANALGINSTPTLVINGTPLSNAFDIGGIRAEIDRILGESGSN